MKKAVADEDIPKPIVEKLRAKGFEIFYIEEEMKSSTDQQVVKKASSLNRPILTFDDDFKEFESHKGIFYITKRTHYDKIVTAVEDILAQISNEECENSLIQINPSVY